MKTFKYPPKASWDNLMKRPDQNSASIETSVIAILQDVKNNGDKAVRKYTRALDGREIDSIKTEKTAIDNAVSKVNKELRAAIQKAAANIEAFHKAQLPETVKVNVQEGLLCEQRALPIENIGIYIPGGTAPLFSSVLMMAIPAKIAGCPQISLVTPPGSEAGVDPAILYAASISGVTDIYQIGGAQAIAALAYGTETVPKVDKIMGPGNQYVTKAKQLVNAEGTAIDMPAGPSELMVIADNSAPPEFIAADLLSQAEHGPDSQVFLVTTQASLPEKVNNSIETYLQKLPRQETARRALENSKSIVLNSETELMEFSNKYAPEHLILATKNSTEMAVKITNAGSVFLGNYTPESLGDYASGTNHVLPTNGAAKAYSGINIDTFMKKITFQRAIPEGLETIGKSVQTMAEAEQLDAHSLAVQVRINKKRKQ